MAIHKLKKMLMLAAAALMVTAASADPITREEAQQRAESYLNSLPGARRAPRLKPVTDQRRLAPRKPGLSPRPPFKGGSGHQLTAEKESTSQIHTAPSLTGRAGGESSSPYYVFNLGENEGFVIAAGDDSTYPVLGYCEQGEFDYEQLPDNMKWWLGWMTAQLEDLAENPIPAAKRAPRQAPVHPAVATLCTSTWNQGDPYNQECPKYSNGERCVTGCVATAMAQIMYFHRARSVDETQAAIPGYTWDGMTLEAIPAGSPIDWENMTDSYGGSSTGKQKKAVAQLMRYCGVSVEMMYGIGANGGSAAYSYKVVDALKNYFGYGNSVKYVNSDNAASDAWDATLYKEVSAGRPAFLAGQNKEGGHAFVCDGYDGNQCFHINWGWGGGSDGYYLLSKLNPGSQGIGGSSGGYSDGPEAIVGIEPEYFAEKAITFSDATLKRVATAAWDANGDGKVTFGEAAEVTDLGDVLKGQRIKTFSELYYFTALTSITPDAFADCTTLTTVKLPKSVTAIGPRAFKGCKALKNFALPDGITAIGEEAFDGCAAIAGLELPAALTTIGARAFQGCTGLKAITLPFALASIGDGAFTDCTNLTQVDVPTTMPESIILGSDVFAGMNLAAATLTICQGTRQYYSQTAQWKDFGTIHEKRDLTRSTFIPLQADKTVYLYNVGTGRFLSRGEAWGTQAIVDETPMRYVLKHTDAMADGVFALYSDDTGNNRHYTFRTTTDTNVGSGVAAAFVDGTLSSSAHWQFAEVAPSIYTIQIPATANDFQSAEQFWGVQTDHESNVASPTYGVYSDIVYADAPLNCQWRLVEYDADFTAVYEAAEALQNLIDKANAKRVITTREQAVCDNLESTLEELLAAQKRLRKRLGIIDFQDAAVRDVVLENWDVDSDGEFTIADAAAITEFGTVFSGTDVETLADLQYFTGITKLENNAFQNCKKLRTAVLPPMLSTVGYRVFKGCNALETVEIPEGVETIGVSAFEGCSALKTVRLFNGDVENIRVPASAFKGVTLAEAILFVPFGCREAFAEADVWQNFGTIREMRGSVKPAYSQVAANTPGYIYNVGTRRYIAPGEAYGTQAVVANEGLVYQFRRTNSMAANTYYLYSDQVSQSNKILFRTSTDTKVGDGVKACFVDGTASAKAYWTIEQAADNTFTLQVPQKDATHKDGEYLGIDPNHESKAASPTYGLYWDIEYDGNENNCTWAFITLEDFESANAFNAQAAELADLLVKAADRQIETTAEQAVYDNPAATADDITAAVNALRDKLHYISFASPSAKTLCVALWDTDDDEELSREEAAAVKDIADSFRGQTAIRSLEELRYFTGLTEIPEAAFRSCSALTSIYVPQNVKSVGANAFASTTNLKYMAVLSDAPVTGLADAQLPKNLQLFVPAALVETYAADEALAKCTVQEYTGTPTVTAESDTRMYGRANAKFTFTVTGAPVNGEPVLTCEADATTAVGTYDIVVTPGTITSQGLRCVNGTLTVEKATVTITAKSYTRYETQPNPEFEVTYGSFKNREKAADVILVQPTLECDATPESPAGEYEIRVFGAEAQNYDFNYVPGVLTVLPANDAVRDLPALNAKPSTLHDLSGRPVGKQNIKKGIYIIDGQKRVAK